MGAGAGAEAKIGCLRSLEVELSKTGWGIDSYNTHGRDLVADTISTGTASRPDRKLSRKRKLQNCDARLPDFDWSDSTHFILLVLLKRASAHDRERTSNIAGFQFCLTDGDINSSIDWEYSSWDIEYMC